MRFLIFLCFISCLALVGCGKGEEAKTAEDVLLASVFNKHLYKSEVDGMVPDEATEADSLMIVNAFIESWIRESLLMHEAERNIPNDLKIDELVRDYRSSLIRHNYEKVLVKAELDSLIAPSEMLAFYEKNKEQYKLDQPILRCLFLEVPLSAPDLDQLSDWWKDHQDQGTTDLLEYANLHATQYLLNDSTWYRQDFVLAQLPSDRQKTNNLRSGKELSFKDAQFQYYLKILETMSADEIAPVGFIADQISRVILHKRKIDLLKSKREEIYEKEIDRNTIKVYN